MGPGRLGEACWDSIALNNVGTFYDPFSKREIKITKEQIDERMGLDMACVSAIKSCEVLVVHGDRDTVCPVEDAFMYQSAIQGCTVKVIKGANHIFSGKQALEDMLAVVAAFVGA
mmetsp:Transcript_37017/g.116461  ORF Transcript_37017/g.116461 Transcript_37017/m.116461 type:complete len:115 (-) Transcript_37017:95-439(-)